MLIRNGNSGHHCLVPDFNRKAFSFSLLSIRLTGLVINRFYYVETDVPSVPILGFVMNGCLILSNAFSTSIEMIMWVSSFL